MEIGNQLLSDCKREYQFIESGKKIKNIRKILIETYLFCGEGWLCGNRELPLGVGRFKLGLSS